MEHNPIRKLVKEIQFKTDKTLDDIAAELNYTGAYFRNEVSKGKSKAIEEAIRAKFNDLLDNKKGQDGAKLSVQHPVQDTALPKDGLEVTIKDYLESIKEQKNMAQKYAEDLKEIILKQLQTITQELHTNQKSLTILEAAARSASIRAESVDGVVLESLAQIQNKKPGALVEAANKKNLDLIQKSLAAQQGTLSGKGK